MTQPSPQKLGPPRPSGGRGLRTAALVAIAFVMVILTVAIFASGSGSPSQTRSEAPTPTAAPPPGLEFEPTAVTLNYHTREMEIRGRLTKAAGSSAPGQVWIWAYFQNPSEGIGGSRSDEPILVTRPFRDGRDTAAIVARGPFHWATNEEAPTNGYYAKIRVSQVSAEDAQLRVKYCDCSPQGIRVVSRP